jgi:site-specific DNA-methyltransferase (adenine-specific)
MIPTLTIGDATIYHGSNLDVLPTLADCSVDSIVCDPPYELGFMGKSWDSSGIAYSVELWRECLRVLKPGGHLLAFGGTRTWHRLVVAIEDAGFEVRDSIAWLYGSGFPKSHNIGKALRKTDADVSGDWDGWGTALKPAHEPIVVARKPVEGTVANNVLTYGTGALNIDATRIKGAEGENFERPVNFTGQHEGYTRPWQSTAEGQEKNAESRKESAQKATDFGRWPANIILDEFTAELLDKQSGLVKGAVGMKKHTDFTFDVGDHGGQRFTQGKPDIGGASRFFYVTKANKRDRNEGLDELSLVQMDIGDERPSGSSWERRGQSTAPRQNFHPTVKPTALMQYLIRLVTPEDGVVLDPFVGSGSTGKAAILERKKFIGIELTAEYLPIIEGRLRHAYTTLDDE